MSSRWKLYDNNECDDEHSKDGSLEVSVAGVAKIYSRFAVLPFPSKAYKIYDDGDDVIRADDHFG